MIRFVQPMLVLVAAVSVLALGGCGGDDESDDGGGNQSTATSDAGGGEEPTQDGDAGATGDANDELRQLAENFGTEPMKVTYSFSITGTGADDGSITVSWLPDVGWRADIESSGVTGIIISKGADSYFCTESDGQGQCIASPAGQAATLPFLGIFTDPKTFADLVDTSLGGLDFEREERQIAGQDATCYSASGEIQGQDGSASYCFGENGLLLSLETTGGGGGFRLEATNVEGNAAEADLDPPYEILEVPGT